MKYRSFFFCFLLAVLLAFLTVQPASAVPVPMAWLWRQPPHDPAYPGFPRPWADVVAWGGPDRTTIYVGTTESTRPDMPHGLYRSGDQGITWEYLGKVDEDGHMTQLVVHPTRPEIMLAGFYGGGIYRSADGGDRWTNVLPSLGIQDIEIDPSHPNIIFAAVFGINNPYVYCHIYKSVDEGQTWQCLSPFSWVPDLAVHPTSSNILFAVNRLGVFRSNDSGSTWEQISEVPGDYIRINPNNPDQMFTFGDYNGGIWRSNDGGRSWSDTSSPLPWILGISPLIQTAVLDPDNPGTIWVGLKYDGMYVSHDSGDTWEQASLGIYFLGGGIYGPQCESSDIANGRLTVACSGRTYIQVPRDSVSAFGVGVEGTIGAVYTAPLGSSMGLSYEGLNRGPMHVIGDRNLLVTEQMIYKPNGGNTSFNELIGLPNSQLDTTYWLPWYNNVDLKTQLRFANLSNTSATVHVYIRSVPMEPDPILLSPWQSARLSFPGINNGPVKIVSDQNLVVSERVIYKANGVNTSLSEMMAIPNKALDTTYWLPWYNNRDLDTQLRFANAGSFRAQVRVYIGGMEMQGSPFTLLPGESIRKSFPGVNAGPVKIVSDQNIVAAERVIYKVNGVNTSFTEMMALPDSQLSTTYWLPGHNNRDLETQLRFANVHETQTATVHVYLGSVEMQNSPFTLLPGQSTRQNFAGIDDRLVKIVSDVPIVAAERLIYKVNNVPTSFYEMMALPDHLLDTVYWFPLYSNILDLDMQLRVSVP